MLTQCTHGEVRYASYIRNRKCRTVPGLAITLPVSVTFNECAASAVATLSFDGWVSWRIAWSLDAGDVRSGIEEKAYSHSLRQPVLAADTLPRRWWIRDALDAQDDVLLKYVVKSHEQCVPDVAQRCPNVLASFV